MANDEKVKVAIVTGASSGIGREIALDFARLGHKVTIVGRNLERLQETLHAMIRESPSKNADHFSSLQVDLKDTSKLDQIVESTVEKFHGLDILINNAGFDTFLPITDDNFLENFKDVMQVNLIAPTRLSQLAVPHLKQTKGVIINISSVADTLGGTTVSYSVAKAGLSMLTKSLANSLDGTGVRVVTVAPGPVDTSFHPGLKHCGPLTLLNRICKPEEVANVVSFLASEKASFINATTIYVDGGFLTKFNGIFQQGGISLNDLI